jgi:outer membrane immunogenic protein
MKKLFLASATLGALAAGSAWSADLPPMPAYTAPIAAPSVYNWTGFYIGGHLGGAWDETNFSQRNLIVPRSVGQSGSLSASSVAGGGQIGVNWMATPNIVLGLEADVSGTDLRGSTTTHALVGPIALGWNDKVDAFGTVRGRLGYAMNNWLFYGTGGFAWANDAFTRTQLVGGATTPPPGFVFQNNTTRTGWTAGGGIEWGFAPNWTAKAEYLYLDLDGQNFNFTVANAAGAVPTIAVNQGRLGINTARVGVNYLFNWGGPAVGGY